MRAILLASATAATLYGRRAIWERTQAGSFTPRRASLRIDVAPTISSVRSRCYDRTDAWDACEPPSGFVSLHCRHDLRVERFYTSRQFLDLLGHLQECKSSC